MNNKSLKKYLLASALPLIILLTMTFLPLYTQFYGTEVLLKTKPFDPRDLFRGDYVILDYEINEIEIAKLPKDLIATMEKDSSFYNLYNQDIYVLLKKAGDHHVIETASLEKPEAGLYIKGKIEYLNFNWEAVEAKPNPKSELEPPKEELLSVVVSYGLDKFFVPENTGLELEDLSRKGQLVARVKVHKGYPVLMDVYPAK